MSERTLRDLTGQVTNLQDRLARAKIGERLRASLSTFLERVAYLSREAHLAHQMLRGNEGQFARYAAIVCFVQITLGFGAIFASLQYITTLKKTRAAAAALRKAPVAWDGGDVAYALLRLALWAHAATVVAMLVLCLYDIDRAVHVRGCTIVIMALSVIVVVFAAIVLQLKRERQKRDDEARLRREHAPLLFAIIIILHLGSVALSLSTLYSPTLVLNANKDVPVELSPLGAADDGGGGARAPIAPIEVARTAGSEREKVTNPVQNLRNCDGPRLTPQSLGHRDVAVRRAEDYWR